MLKDGWRERCLLLCFALTAYPCKCFARLFSNPPEPPRSVSNVISGRLPFVCASNSTSDLSSSSFPANYCFQTSLATVSFTCTWSSSRMVTRQVQVGSCIVNGDAQEQVICPARQIFQGLLVWDHELDPCQPTKWSTSCCNGTTMATLTLIADFGVRLIDIDAEKCPSQAWA